MTHTITPAPSGLYAVKTTATEYDGEQCLTIDIDVSPILSVKTYEEDGVIIPNPLDGCFLEGRDFCVLDMNSGLVFTTNDRAIPLWKYKDYAIGMITKRSTLKVPDSDRFIFTDSYDQLVSTFPGFEKKQAEYIMSKTPKMDWE